MKKTHTCGELSLLNINEKVTLIGWVSKRRNFGSIVFIDLRDRTGITQLVFDEELAASISSVRNEYILQVQGCVVERKDKNLNLTTGEIEVKVEKVEIINKANTTPLIIADETDALEDTRLKYRYLDLRRPLMQEKIITRHAIARSMRNYLDDQGYIEIETPLLGKSTPEGARDYLVPSRVHPGNFYALPQSPQLFKQLLMIAGFEKYYQFARCFRDEDLRADRQLDFTQVDIEMSFMDEVEIQTMMEEMLCKVMKEVKGIDVKRPFLRMNYHDAMNTYGSDKPDNRYDLKLQDIGSVFANSTFKVFADCLSNQGSIKAIVIPNKSDMTRKEIDQVTDLAKKNGAKGLVTLKFKDDKLEGSIVKFMSQQEQNELVATLALKANDLILIVSDQWKTTCEVLGALRVYFASLLKLTNKSDYSFLWVVDFPMFEYDEEEGRYYAQHHPFTRPKASDEALLDSNPAAVRADAYDVILNGYELGGGSLRIYDEVMQKKIFTILGFSDEEIKERFGFFVDAFQYGTPPHGGIALGFDRVAMILTESDSIRDVIAFPKNASAKCPMSDAPSYVDEKQLEELHIEIKK
ncbi:MAG: aspartate--tRNA ligase [Erysipelotrichaceae bacterium]